MSSTSQRNQPSPAFWSARAQGLLPSGASGCSASMTWSTEVPVGLAEGHPRSFRQGLCSQTHPQTSAKSPCRDCHPQADRALHCHSQRPFRWAGGVWGLGGHSLCANPVCRWLPQALRQTLSHAGFRAQRGWHDVTVRLPAARPGSHLQRGNWGNAEEGSPERHLHSLLQTAWPRESKAGSFLL